MNLDRIFIGRDGQQLGPYTLADLRRYLAEGRVAPDDQVWCEGMGGWQVLTEAQEIQLALAAATPPALPQGEPSPPQPAYFHVATWKFIILSIGTCGFYKFYWFYQNWRYIRDRDESDIQPFWRMMFSPLWCVALCKDISAHGGSISIGAAFGVAISYFILWSIGNLPMQLPDPWWLVGLLGLFSFIPLVFVVRQIDCLNRARGARAQNYSRFTAAHAAMCVLGVLVLTLGIHTALNGMPGSKILTGQQLPAEDRQFLDRKKIVSADEEILFFHSVGPFSIKDDGSLLTARRVITYTRVPDTDDIIAKSARFTDIEDIRIERARSALEDTKVTIITRKGPEFVVILPSVARGDERFANRLMTLWQAAKLEK